MTLDVSQWRPARTLAKRHGVTVSKIHQWHRDGKLDRVKVGWNDYRYKWPSPPDGTFFWFGDHVRYEEKK